MKLTNVEITAPKATGTFGTSEDLEARKTRMTAFWRAPENAVLIPVGKLLAAAVGPKKETMATLLAAGESIEMDALQIDGKILPLPKGYVLSLKTIVDKASGWGCPACGSAHGSNVKPSPALDADLLASNEFYYRPSDQRLFTISRTCKKDYLNKLVSEPVRKGMFLSVGEWLARQVSKPQVPATAAKGSK